MAKNIKIGPSPEWMQRRLCFRRYPSDQ
ncbi:MAG: hypothetical protein ACLUUO_10270 [Sellimonas intestinalis]